MASTVLPNGIIIPEKYSRDWYNDLYHNWQELDNLLGGGTPKDGTLTIQKNGTTVGTFSANQATDETINITVPDVNDATLTIQQNGTTVDTFTANSSSDKTVNITVPTATSDLTNDSGFITEDNTKIPLAGSNQISGDLIPSTDGTVNLGSTSYQWNNAYIKSLTINGVACGDILTHNASEFVNVTSAQTIGGAKTFYTSATSYPIIKLKTAFIEQGLYDSDNLRGVAFRCADKNDAILGDFGYKTERTGEVGSYFSTRTKVNNTQTTREVKLRFKPGSTDCELVPDTTNLIDLGTSTYKWKTINGIAPDELGLPTSTYTDVSSYITNFDGTANTFTAPVSGILQIDANGKTVVDDTILIVNAVENDGTYRSIMPVTKGDTVTICTLASSVIAKICHLKGKI